MGHALNVVGFIVVLVLYAVIGALAAAGTIFLARRFLGPKAEQIFYGMFLIMIAAFYLAFAAYFGVATAWPLEAAVVAAFVVIGIVAVRLPFALIVGYSLHGVWDVLHELQAHGGYSAFEPGRLTAIPLAYGVFCASFDLCMAGYSYARRKQWIAAWKESGGQNRSAVEDATEPTRHALLGNLGPVTGDLPVNPPANLTDVAVRAKAAAAADLFDRPWEA